MPIDNSVIEIDRELILKRGDLTHAAMVIFQQINPSIVINYNWHIGCICEHLRAMELCQILRLLINLPPRCLKTWLISVIWPTVAWMNDPSTNWIHISYDDDLHEKTAPRRRDIIQSDWYQDVSRKSWELREDANKKLYFFNTAGGSSYSTTTRRGGAGFDADYVVFDDPNKVSSTKTEFRDVFAYFSSQIVTRGNDPKKYRICVTQQRIDSMDLSGCLFGKDLGFEALILPMRYEPGRICYSWAEAAEKKIRYPIIPTPLQKQKPSLMDPRTVEGELLHPERFSEKEVEDIGSAILAGGGTVAGQFQQRPSEERGTIYLSDWFLDYSTGIREVNDIPEKCFCLIGRDGLESIVRVSDCRAFIVVDTAVKADEQSDFLAAGYFILTPSADILLHGLLHAKIAQPYQMDALTSFFASNGVWDDQILSFKKTEDWPIDPLFLAIEDRATGSGLLMTAAIGGYPVRSLEPGGADKVARSALSSTMYKRGMIYHRAGQPWIEVVKAELTEFPKGENDDIADIIAYAAKLVATDALLRSVVRITSPGQIRDMQERARKNLAAQSGSVTFRTSAGPLEVHFSD